MDFFDKLSETIANNGKNITNKAKEYAEVTKLHAQINAENNKIHNALTSLGKAYYEAHKDEAETEFAEIFEEIKTAHQAIEECQKCIKKIKNIKICGRCGTEVNADAMFCPKCGEKLEGQPEQSEEPATDVNFTEEPETSSEDIVEKESEKRFCPVCGAEISQDVVFCVSCGANIEE